MRAREQGTHITALASWKNSQVIQEDMVSSMRNGCSRDFVTTSLSFQKLPNTRRQLRGFDSEGPFTSRDQISSTYILIFNCYLLKRYKARLSKMCSSGCSFGLQDESLQIPQILCLVRCGMSTDPHTHPGLSKQRQEDADVAYLVVTFEYMSRMGCGLKSYCFC